MLFIGLMSWLARQPPFSQFAIKKKFDLLSNYSFLSLNPCGSGGAESHLLQRWACPLWPGPANRHIPFSWDGSGFGIWQSPGNETHSETSFGTLEEEEISFCWAFLVCWPVCLLVATLLPVDITFPGWGQHRRMQSHADCQVHHLKNWVQLKQIYYPHTLSIDNFFVFWK